MCYEEASIRQKMTDKILMVTTAVDKLSTQDRACFDNNVLGFQLHKMRQAVGADLD